MLAEEPLLLTLDYPGYRKEARIADLGLADHGVRTVELLRRPLPRAATGPAYAARLLAGRPAGGGPVAAVAAYCASAPLAFEVAAALAGPDGPSLIVLFDAEGTTADAVAGSYREALAQLGVDAGEDEVRARVDPSLLASAPDRLVADLVDGLEREAAAALRGMGGSAREAADGAARLAGTYADWLSHLVAAHHCVTSAWTGRVVHVMSAEARPGAFAHAAGERQEVRVDCDRAELLRRPQARAALLGALREGVR
ncbi:hypothetical protein ACFY4K_19245 [Streptomyces leeuwenhoekii]|uniref:hypothetical protein n=1 Tax=Streptomyces leeuwenhoekii TaxID=1437453 RepID=UPI0036CDB755